MSRPYLLLTLAVLSAASFAGAQTTVTDTLTTEGVKTAKKWPDPKRFDKEITTLETSAPATQGAIIAYGSSSIRGWHKTIAEDLAPLTIVPRGFGGSNMNDALHFTDRVIVSAKPRAVLLYEGDNDIAGSYPMDEILSKYRQFIERTHKALPSTRVYLISVKPSILRWKFWPAAQELNRMLKGLADADPLVTYIDIATPMLKDDGTPREDIFLADKLHMNRKGYEIWRDAVRPILVEKEAQHEGKSN